VKLLVTGGSGSIGAVLRDRLPALGHSLRSFDLAPPAQVLHGEETVVGDATDADAVAAAVEGVDAVVHLAGIPHEAPLPDILSSHVVSTATALEAARRAGVRRFVYASSNHAVGFTPRPAAGAVAGDVPHRPDTFYGVGKVAAEGLCSLYADRHGLECVSLRIGSFGERPLRRRHLSTWLSPGDGVRAVHAAVTGPVEGFVAFWGVSANTRGWWDLAAGRAVGYEPEDDAEAWAEELLATPETDHDRRDGSVVGGEYAVLETDVRYVGPGAQISAEPPEASR
jgi:uronate dehydrogenase